MLPVLASKSRLRFTGRDALVALLGASSLLLFSHLYGLRPASFLPPPIHGPPYFRGASDEAVLPEGFTLTPPSEFAPPGRLFVAPPRTKGVTASTLLAHAPGWTFFTNLYLSNGTFFIVSDEGGFDEGYWPQRRLITATGLPGDHENGHLREPTDKEMQVITVDEARKRWGERVWDVEGLSLICNDPDQFLKHYYHVAAELLFGTERMLTNFDPMPQPDGSVLAPSPDRIIFVHCDEAGFTDSPRFNQFFLPAMWPSITPMFKPTFDQFADLVRTPYKAFRFPAALFIDRSAAFRGDQTGPTSRTPAGPWMIGGGQYGTGGEGRNKYWYENARRRVGAFAGVPHRVLDMGLRAMDPPLVDGEPDAPVITYISRQRSRRRLIEADHQRLVQALEDMCHRKGWVLDVVHAEELSREEQLRRAARTVVMLGVHGNGLTHQLLMPPHPLSTVIEMFYPGGYARDYEWTAGVLGKAYFGIQNDTVVGPPNIPDFNYPEGFHGNAIPVQAEVVVRVIEERLEGKRERIHWSGHSGLGY
ncbi:hypothetical protein DACRYDRAFT_72262 [Dacryopinax primogenitus]|uniref:Glycosyltransferase 61 catalytic domain-containing protein n=1 Tax=Dacryopinax primogenitus (strain DJM 731) TaxID=1858805 RepID=M5FNF9_DACPD|nr:uncharacterized protein DACRYDRAFT_72262 [Dacryopinax primogenitus]EJT97375.1 hypothetical protein DACRYDRAFT_72262 [Dacryopinax primogenitus]